VQIDKKILLLFQESCNNGKEERSLALARSLLLNKSIKIALKWAHSNNLIHLAQQISTFEQDGMPLQLPQKKES